MASHTVPARVETVTVQRRATFRSGAARSASRQPCHQPFQARPEFGQLGRLRLQLLLLGLHLSRLSFDLPVLAWLPELRVVQIEPHFHFYRLPPGFLGGTRWVVALA